MIKKKDLSQKDKKIWNQYIKDPSDIYDKDKDNTYTNQIKKRYKFDLHGFTLDEANNKVKEIIQYCVKNKFRELKKDNMLHVLSKKPFIPTDNEISLNKRSRSAKMRVGEKIG